MLKPKTKQKACLYFVRLQYAVGNHIWVNKFPQGQPNKILNFYSCYVCLPWLETAMTLSQDDDTMTVMLMTDTFPLWNSDR